MNHKICWLAAAAAVLFTTACKKDDSGTTLPGLTGLYMERVLPYVASGTTITCKAKTADITTTDKSTPGDIGLYWQVNTQKKDTTTRNIRTSNPEYTVTLTETGSYSIYCYAYAANYYNTSSSVQVEVIDPETAVTGVEGEPDLILNGNPYRSVQAGGLTWIADNLYGTGTGTVLLKCEILSSLFGRFYTWEEAMTACPDGWRLPTAEEFDACFGTAAGDLMVNASFLKTEMWPYRPEVTITNSTRFNALPIGYQDLTSENYADRGFGEYAFWWTSSADEERAEYRYIHMENPVIQKGKGNKQSFALSVRCVKEI